MKTMKINTTIKIIFLLCLQVSSAFCNTNLKHLGKAEGLSQVSVLSICQDELGRMWFGTLEGLNCYDGQNVKIYRPGVKGRESTFFGNEIYNLASDHQGHLLFTSNQQVILYDLYEERFSNLNFNLDKLHAKDSQIWGTVRDSILLWNPSTKQFDFIYKLNNQQKITCLQMETSHSGFIGTTKGVYKIEIEKHPSVHCLIPQVYTYNMYQDRRKNLWIAIYHKGIYKIRMDKNDTSIEKDFTLSSPDVRCFAEDEAGNIWAGTFNGLNKIDLTGQVTHYSNDAQPYNQEQTSIYSLYKDKQGSLWIGTYYGGVYYFNPQIDIFHHFSSHTSSRKGLNSSITGKMLEDKRGNIWICTEKGGLNLLDRKQEKFSYFLHQKSPQYPAFHSVKCMAYDEKKDLLYVGTHKQGLLCLSLPQGDIQFHTTKAGQSFNHIQFLSDKLYLLSEKGMFIKQEGKLQSLYPFLKVTQQPGNTFFIDSQHRLWIAQKQQIVRVNMDNPHEICFYQYGKNGLDIFQAQCITEDKTGRIFIGTSGGGLYEFQEKASCFTPHTILDIHYCYDIQVHENNTLIISNENGVLTYHPDRKEIKFISAEKQLQLTATNDNGSLLLCKNGDIFAGGIGGITRFNLSSLSIPTPPYQLYFSSLKVNDVPLTYNESQGNISKALPFTDKVTLAHNENNLSISFSTNNYTTSAYQPVYEYYLEGFSKKWSTTYEHFITYTNLAPGKYKLIVQEKASGQQGGSHKIELPIQIYSPWWATKWAYILYTVLGIISIHLFLKNRRNRIRLQTSLVKEKLEKEKKEELIQAKQEFFANVSHEFRTPLTLITAQIEILLQHNNLSPYLKGNLQKIYKNTSNLKELITELLDFNKAEERKLQLRIAHMNLIPYLEQIFKEFQSQAQRQKIHFKFHTETNSLICWYDPYQFKKIISNLLSNSFKYTAENGTIELQVAEQETTIEIKVIDNGAGIPKEAIPHLFERFYQASNSEVSSGSGIGLAFSNYLAELHHGKISVSSALNYGSIFTVTLPKENMFQGDDHVTFISDEIEEFSKNFQESTPVSTFMEKEDLSTYTNFQPNISEEETNCKDKILIIEDNEELLQLLLSLLSPLYRVTLATNGKEGLEKALEESPDLIISDVMMPIMNGTEMCKKIKNDLNLCHIPVILLTALTSEKDKLNGLKCGADAYIEKPFTSRILLGQIANLLYTRKLLRKKYEENPANMFTPQRESTPLGFSKLDTLFLKKIEQIIYAHLSDDTFDVNALAKELLVSRSSLYNKLKALGNITPNELILNIRLEHAAQLLQTEPDLQITEVAYRTGFNSLRHFRYCFKARFNLSPQEYKAERTKNFPPAESPA